MSKIGYSEKKHRDHNECEGKWEDTGSKGWEFKWEGSVDVESATNTASLAGDLCRRATALRRTLYKMPGLINQRTAFLEIIK